MNSNVFGWMAGEAVKPPPDGAAQRQGFIAPRGKASQAARDALKGGSVMTAVEIGNLIGRPADNIYSCLRQDMKRGLVIYEPPQPGLFFEAAGGESPNVRRAIDLLKSMGYTVVAP